MSVGASTLKAAGLEGVFLRHSPTVWAALAVTAVLVLLAAINGAARNDALQTTLSQAVAAEQQLAGTLKAAVERYEAQPTEDAPPVTSPGAVGLSILSHSAAKPPSPFSALATGLSDVKPNAYPVTAHGAYSFMNRTEIKNPLNQQTGGFDLAFVIIFVVPVFIVALTFDLLSGEKERGTLSLVLSHGVSIPTVVLSKILMRAGVVLGALALLNVIAFAIVGVEFSDPTHLAQAGLWLGLSTLYGAFWFALGLVISTFNWPSVTNGVVLANLWLVLVVVLPALVNVAAMTIYPPPSRVELTTELREAAKEVDEASAEAREDYFFDHPELAGGDANPDAFFFQVIATETAISAAIAPTLMAFDDQAAAQEKLVSRLSYLSPAILAKRALTSVAGNDRASYQNFRQQVEAFHVNWQSFFSIRILSNARLSSADYDRFPSFSYDGAALVETRAAVSGPLVGLSLMTLIALLWGALAVRRYPPV